MKDEGDVAKLMSDFPLIAKQIDQWERGPLLRPQETKLALPLGLFRIDVKLGWLNH